MNHKKVFLKMILLRIPFWLKGGKDEIDFEKNLTVILPAGSNIYGGISDIPYYKNDYRQLF